MDISIGLMWCHLHWCHVMPLSLVPVSYGADSIINGTIAFLGARQSIWGAMLLFWSCDAISNGVCIMWFEWQNQWHTHCFRWPRWPNWGKTWLILVMWHNQHQHLHHMMLIALSWHHYIPYVKMIIMRCKHDFLVMWCYWYQDKCNMMSIASSVAPLQSFGQDNWNEVKHDLFLVMWCHQHQHHMIPMTSSMAKDTGASTGTTTWTKSHIIPLNNDLNMTNAMVSLMEP